jgi:hypothetical protein
MIVKHVVFEFSLDVHRLVVVLLRIRLVVFVAAVITSSMSSMVGPVSSAQPTKFISTTSRILLANHMHATSVLFDRGTAHWASFRVGKKPVDILGFVGGLVEPSLNLRTSSWCMITNLEIATTKTKPKSTFACYWSGFSFTTNGIYTTRCGTPFNLQKRRRSDDHDSAKKEGDRGREEEAYQRIVGNERSHEITFVELSFVG